MEHEQAGPAPGKGLPDEVLRTARLLRDGFNDKAIARLERVSQRTVRRRVAILMEALRAETRFHAGYVFYGIDRPTNDASGRGVLFRNERRESNKHSKELGHERSQG